MVTHTAGSKHPEPHPRFDHGCLVAVQLELGAGSAVVHLQRFGPYDASIPVTILEAIDRLPPDAKLAYVCQPFDETGWVVTTLQSITAHTGRRVAPMCYEAEVLSTLVGAPRSLGVAGIGFDLAPQSVLYPSAESRPSSEEVEGFMRSHGIDYIFADATHPNDLVGDAVPIATSGNTQILKLP